MHCDVGRHRTPGRDAISSTLEEYGWGLEIYGLERLRTQLSGPQNHLLAAYPSIFLPRFFQNVGGILTEKEHRDVLLIDHTNENFAFAAWLARRLELQGYNVCGAGQPVNETDL